MTRRLFLLACALVMVGLGCLAYGFLVEPYRLTTRTVTVEADTDRELRIVVVSDLHAGGHTTYADDVGRVREAIDAFAPDLVLFAGDFVAGSLSAAERSPAERTSIADALSPLMDVSAPAGVYAVLGNHDHWYGTREVERLVDTLGLNRIDNRAVVSGGVCIAGLGDEWEGQPDLAVVGGCPDAALRVVLAHNPDTVLRMRTPFDLAVAGHTHGGQINLPILGRAVTSTRAGRPFAYGLRQTPGGPIYITAGVGTSILPARFRAPPEVALIRLVPREGVARPSR